MDAQQLIARAPLRTASILAALVLCGAAIAAIVSGARWFVVETPSMGTAAPVGSLVVTTPGPIRVGEVIAFTPPGVPRTYTHRVFATTPAGIETKGDINGAADPWTIRPSAVIGTAVAIVPGGGYVLRGLPPFLACGAAVWVLTGFLLRRRDRRSAARIIGLHLVATGVLLWLHPFVQVVTVATEADGSRTAASVVSTGLLPIRLVDTAGDVLAHLTTGTPEVVGLPSSRDRITAVPDLSPGLQALLLGVALLPALAVLAIGLPEEREEA